MSSFNSGYVGYSMSVRASNAYEHGEKPLSKWTKAAILNDLEEKEVSNLEYIKTWSLAKMKRNLLHCSSWHHTSKFFNQTDFYEVIDKEEVEAFTKESDDAREKAEKDSLDAFRKEQYQRGIKLSELLNSYNLKGYKVALREYSDSWNIIVYSQEHEIVDRKSIFYESELNGIKDNCKCLLTGEDAYHQEVLMLNKK
jgi:hypothetical protein